MRLVNYWIPFLVSGWLVLMSVSLPVWVTSKEELISLQFGWPLSFVGQNQSRYDPPLPRWISILLNPWETPTRVLWPQLLFDMAIVFGVVVIISKVLRTLDERFSVGEECGRI